MVSVPFTGDLTLIIFLIIILAVVSIGLSIISIALVRSAARRISGSPQPVARGAAAPPPPPKPATARAEVAEKAVVRAPAKPSPPPPRPPAKGLEIKPVEPGEEYGFASLEELASMLGLRSVILLNQSGIPIDSYNVSDEDRVAASVADFVSLVRSLSPEFSAMVSEDAGQRVMLLEVGRIGESEVYALAVGGGSEFGAEEVRDLLRAYLAESLGRFR